MRDTIRLALLSALLSAMGAVCADADGPDFFRVTGMAQKDVLNMRAEPDPQAKKVGAIPPDGTCLRNLGCRGGLTFQEFTELSEEQKAVRLKENPRWCKVEYRGVEGWVEGGYLKEGTCDAAAVDPDPDVSHLVGVRGRDGERKLLELGYIFQGGHKEKSRSLTFFRKPETGRCLQVVTQDGRYQILGYVDGAQCQSAAEASVAATGETSLSGQPGSESFQTVCGIVVDGMTHRYLCQVTDIKGDRSVKRTALRFPDNELRLLWGEGNQVRVQIEGLATATPATFSTSEGETDIFFDGKTYFYYSDRRSAAMEVEHFKP